MSAADLHDLELIWPSPRPTHVVVTGTFDQWSSSIHLVKGDTGFFGTVKVPWGEKVAYKFIVDGSWQCRGDRPQEDDGNGNINNVLRTPEKPQAVFPVVHDPPARLSIPLEGAQSGDAETMVTAVEYLPPVEPVIARGLLPHPIPQITVEGLALTPSVSTPVSVSKLDSAAATEGTVPPASKMPAELAPSKEVLSSSGVSILPINENGSVSLPPVNGNEQAQDSYSFATHAPIQFTKGYFPISPLVPETAKQAISAPLEAAAPQFNRSPQGVQDAAALTDRVNVLIPGVVSELTAKQPEVDPQGHRRQATVSASSAPAPSTSTHKKRRSLFARIKHIFDKDSNRREKKEKNKH